MTKAHPGPAKQSKSVSVVDADRLDRLLQKVYAPIDFTKEGYMRDAGLVDGVKLPHEDKGKRSNTA